jgi:hypothetical protein
MGRMGLIVLMFLKNFCMNEDIRPYVFENARRALERGYFSNFWSGEMGVQLPASASFHLPK